jgi:hypothetical protein
MTANTIRKAPPWHAPALQKFYSIDGQVAGLRSSLNAANEHLANLSRRIREVEAEREELQVHIGRTPILHGRQADRDRIHENIAELGHEIDRLQVLFAEALRQRDALAVRLGHLAPLYDRCARLLVSLKLLARNEVAL